MTKQLLDQTAAAASALPISHGLGPVADDWAAAQVWLRAIASRGRRCSPETVATYGYHLAKLRWFCEHVHGVPPSRWTVQDVAAFYAFLADLPADALCARDPDTRAYASPGEDGYTPSRIRPSKSSRSDIQRCIHAMFSRLARDGLHPDQSDGIAWRRYSSQGALDLIRATNKTVPGIPAAEVPVPSNI